MKNLLLKILKILFYTALVVLTVLIVFGAVMSLDWPWWVGFFILLGLLGLFIAGLFFRKIWLKRREQQFVQQIIEQDESQLRMLAERDKQQARELQDRWKEAMESLRRSHLRKRGNPLYVLPWYLVIGESGAGKSTAIQSARLSSAFSEANRVSGLSGTRNCDWWFFDQAVIIDTAGRYTIRIDEERDKDEWQKFLTLLSKYRQREPLNGLIVSLAADKALQGTPESLEEDGRNVRRRVDELMRVLGAKFPVYVLLTKCDLAQGMTQFSNQLPEKSLDQAMGYINHNLTSDLPGFLGAAFEKIGERLRDLRLLVLHQSESKKIDPPLLLFPEEFEKLRTGVEAFMKGAFHENPYQETPIMRGIFFSSGRQEGTPYSHFLKTLGLIEEKDVLPGTGKGLFLHDFFSTVLPRDRALFAPTKRSMEWSRVTRNLGLTAWIAICLAVCGLLSLSFVKNLGVLRYVTNEFSERPEYHGEVMSDMAVLDRLRIVALGVEDLNRRWWVPRFGLNQSKEVELNLKEYYCKTFHKNFLTLFDEQMNSRIAAFTDMSPDVVIGQHACHLVRRINLLKARFRGEGLSALQAKSQPSYDPTLSKPDRGVEVPKQDLFGKLYLYYLVWRRDVGNLETEATNLQKWLDRLIAIKGGTLRWLAGWADAQPFLSSINMESFWKGSLKLKETAVITPAYTQKGKELIDSLLGETELAVATPQTLVRPKTEFGVWYRREYLGVWNRFLVLFPNGIQTLNGREEWRQTAAKVATDEGPYFAVLKCAADELEPMAVDLELPAWLKQVLQFQITKLQVAAEDMAQDKGVLGKAADAGRKLVGEIEKTISKIPGQSMESRAKAVEAYRDYMKSLSALTPVSESPKLAYDIAAQVFSQDEATGQSPYFTARKASAALKTNFSGAAVGDESFWKIAWGPLDVLWYYMRQETSCYLQKRWEEEVVSEAQVISDQQLLQKVMLGESGLAWKYAKSSAAPFLGRSPQKSGYYAKDVKGDALPFESSFFNFLNKGAVTSAASAGVKSNYTVTVNGLPTDAGTDGNLKPHATRLELRCEKGSQRLDNYNYPCSATFNYAPDTCTGVLLTIEVGDVVLTRGWEGYLAFARFLRDYRGGERTYRDRDFPRQRADLERLGVRSITVKYRFGGAGPVIDLLAASPSIQVPHRILKCWDR